MNETLEVMARALFKSWFVDFDPVRAMAAGSQPIGVDPATASLFPSEFEYMASRAFPRGWQTIEVGAVSEIIDCLHSKKPSRQAAGQPLLQLWNIRNDGLIDMSDTYWVSTEDYLLWTSRIEASQGDCVVTNVGRVGAVAQIPRGLRAALGRNMTAVRCQRVYGSVSSATAFGVCRQES